MTVAMPNETYDWDSLAERLRARADEGWPDSWQPTEAGDELLGVVVAVNPAAPTRAYGSAPVVVIETPVGARRSVWLFHKVLRQGFVRQKVALGEMVLIRYLGKATPEGGGNSYDNYTLVVDRPEPSGTPNWDAIDKRYDRAGELDADPGPEGPPPTYAEEDDIPF